MALDCADTSGSYFELDQQRRRRLSGTVMPGEIVDSEIKGGDSPNAVPTYEFTPQESETIRAEP